MTSILNHAIYRTRWATLVIAPANISVLTDVFAWLIVPLIAVRRF
jgi:hypothetical protein